MEITNENRDKSAVLQTLATVMQTLATNPMILNDPNARLVFNKILNETATVSPLELSSVSANPSPVPTASPPETGGANREALLANTR